MQLNEQAISEFQHIYHKECGVAISREQAIEYGTRLIDIIKVVYGNHLSKSLDVIKQRGYDKHGHS